MIVSSRPWFWIGRALGAAAFGVGSGVLATDGTTTSRVLGTLGAVLFGAFALYGLRQALRRGPRLVLSADGVMAADAGPDLIPWDEITGVEAFGSDAAPFIGFGLRDAAARVARMPPWPRFMARLLAAQGVRPLAVNLIGVDRSPAEVQAFARCAWRTATRGTPGPGAKRATPS